MSLFSSRASSFERGLTTTSIFTCSSLSTLASMLASLTHFHLFVSLNHKRFFLFIASSNLEPFFSIQTMTRSNGDPDRPAVVIPMVSERATRSKTKGIF